MSEIERAMEWTKAFQLMEEDNRNTYEDTCGSGDMTDEERKGLYEVMDSSISLFKTIKEALEKQISKKPRNSYDFEYFCPSCDTMLSDGGYLPEDLFCGCCGQRLDLT